MNIHDKLRFTVSKNQLLPLYNVNGVANKLDFPLNYPVLAMFPQTTTFYKGKITDCLKTTVYYQTLSSMSTQPDKYVIQFEDDIQDNIQVIGRYDEYNSIHSIEKFQSNMLFQIQNNDLSFFPSLFLFHNKQANTQQ